MLGHVRSRRLRRRRIAGCTLVRSRTVRGKRPVEEGHTVLRIAAEWTSVSRCLRRAEVPVNEEKLMEIMMRAGREPSEYPHSVFCKRHSTHRDTMSDVLPPLQPFGYPSSPLASSSRRRAPSFSDPGFLPSTPLPSFEPYTSFPSFDATLPSTSYSFDAQPPTRRRTFSRSTTWPQSMQELPPLGTSYDGPPRAFRDLLQGIGSSSRSSRSNRPSNRPYY
jgi:hypothetical protein